MLNFISLFINVAFMYIFWYSKLCNTLIQTSILTIFSVLCSINLDTTDDQRGLQDETNEVKMNEEEAMENNIDQTNNDLQGSENATSYTQSSPMMKYEKRKKIASAVNEHDSNNANESPDQLKVKSAQKRITKLRDTAAILNDKSIISSDDIQISPRGEEKSNAVMDEEM